MPVDERTLRSLLAIHDRLSAKLATAVGRFDAAGLWDLTGATSMKTWLRDEGYAGPGAHRLAVLGRRLLQLPTLAAAWADGDISNGQVRAVAAQLTDASTALFAEAEHAFVPALVGLSVDDTNRLLTEWRARADAELDREPDDPDLSLHHSATLEGRFVTNGTFDGDGGSVIAPRSRPPTPPTSTRPPHGAEPRRWSTSAGSSSTTTRSTCRRAAGRTSRWSSTQPTPARARWSTSVSAFAPGRWGDTCATARSAASSPTASPGPRAGS
ncbi:MAG TPA: DUF222 domain-containing protein [Acidimicrobiales bacterium]